jgi:methionyl-tRNA synthetase
MFTTSYAAKQLGMDTGPGELWQVEANRRMVHVLGFDNAFFFCFPHIALVMAHGDRYIRPEWIINNEFYELESTKFSTSKGHVVTVQDLLREVPRDVARLYLALTAPEHGRTTFSRAGLARVADDRLVGPWNRLAETLGKAVANAGGDGSTLPVSALGRRRVGAMLARFDAGYEMPNYSLSRSADTILVHIERLARRAATLDGSDVADDPGAWGDLFFEVEALITAAAPILIDLAVAARRTAGLDRVLAAEAFGDVAEVRPFAPPVLGAGAAGAPAGAGSR